jgi:two-component system response regulator FixJ
LRSINDTVGLKCFLPTMTTTPPLRFAPEWNDRPCVVVVEDDAALLSALQFSLEAEGYEVRAFSNQIDVLNGQDIVSNASCLVVDFHLNPLDGLELYALLQSRGLKAPAILITSQPDDQCLTAAARLGVPIIEKPLLTDALSRQIRALIAAPGLH